MITAQRAIVWLSSAALAVSAAPGFAQVQPGIVLNIMRECAKIGDPTARLACYDNNIRAAGGTPSSIPGQMARPSGGGAVANPNGPGGFGAEDVRTQERFNPERNGAREISSRVAAVREREPGVYLVTLDGGAQWLFAESTSRTYQPPKKGDTIRIERGALGSFMLIANRQQGVKVTRIK